jgi:voltage-gated potassium channel
MKGTATTKSSAVGGEGDCQRPPRDLGTTARVRRALPCLMTQSSWRRYAEWPLLVASVVFLIAYSIEVIEDLPDSRSAVFDWVIWTTWILFIIDFIANLVLAERRMRWLLRNLHEVVILALPVLRPLRLLRLFALLRLMRSFAANALRGRVVTYAIGGAILLTYAGALGTLDAEQDAPGSNIRNIGDALWWAMATLTTVGYGDHYPVTLIGRCVAVGLMIGGIALLGIVTAAIASWLVEQVGTRADDLSTEAELATKAELSRVSEQLDRLMILVERQNAMLATPEGQAPATPGT